MSRFDWPALLRAGFYGAGLRPDAFWALTPAELMLLLGRTGAAAPMGRAGLMALQDAYPDTSEDTRDG